MRGRWTLLPCGILVTLALACSEDGSPGGGAGVGGTAGVGGAAGAAGAGATGGAGADWVISLDPAGGAGMPPSLLGQYDLSGALYGFDKEAGLIQKMAAVGLGEWRVSVGRWEIGTQLLPTLTGGESCTPMIGGFPSKAFAPAGSGDLDLIGARDWFVDDGQPVTAAMTLDDARYSLGYVRKVIDVATAFGAKPFVSIDLMPRALAANRTPFRDKSVIPDACMASFTNRVSNARPADPAVFGAAVAGMVRRVVEGSGGEPGRAVTHWEIWNEPEFSYFWDKSLDTPELQQFFAMALVSLVSLDDYRKGSSSPAAKGLRFGFGSFATADVAASVVTSLDTTPLPSGGHAPLDFISFHSYANDPLVIVADIQKVAAARNSSASYAGAELVLAEWGPQLDGVGWSPKSMDAPLLVSTVLALGVPLGLARAHHSIFWDYYDGIPFGLLDTAKNPKPLYHAYALLAEVAASDRLHLPAAGFESGRLDGGMGAVLASRDASGQVRVLLVNRGDTARSARVDVSSGSKLPSRLLVFSDPAKAPVEAPPETVFVVPPRSLVLAELGNTG